jgi:hypothetical protein
MVFNTTFNNISVISWQSVLLVEETGVPGKNHQPAVSLCFQLFEVRGGSLFLLFFILMDLSPITV